jgi:cytochrome c-type protein NapC
MQANQSAGCRHCHDIPTMADDPLVSSKARNYHQTLQEPGRTCVDCHAGISHAPLKPSEMP